jgi:hypothetical protein
VSLVPMPEEKVHVRGQHLQYLDAVTKQIKTFLMRLP